MNRKFYTLIFLVTVTATMLVSCKSASKLYKQGNYDEAVEVAVKKLQKKPADAEMKALIQNAYHYAVTDHESRIHNYSESSSDLKYESIYGEYADLHNLYNAIYKAPEVFELVQPVDYSSYVTTYREKAGDAHMQRGINWMKDKDRESYKKAYREFQIAIGFKPNDIKIEKLLNDAYDGALTRVVITGADDFNYQYSSYNYSAQQNTPDEMIRNLGYNSGNEFVKFYSVPEARSQSIQPDEVIELRLNNINLGHVQENRFTKEVTKDVVVKQIVYKPDSVVNVYAKVKARITTIQRTLYSDGNLSITIRDGAGNRVWNDNVNGQSSWSTQFSSYTGDERALSEEDKHLINRRPDNIPNDISIIDCVRKDILNNTLYRIKDYYSRY
jgi:tetratricopeptide (TPR) repeat protein